MKKYVVIGLCLLSSVYAREVKPDGTRVFSDNDIARVSFPLVEQAATNNTSSQPSRHLAICASSLAVAADAFSAGITGYSVAQAKGWGDEKKIAAGCAIFFGGVSGLYRKSRSNFPAKDPKDQLLRMVKKGAKSAVLGTVLSQIVPGGINPYKAAAATWFILSAGDDTITNLMNAKIK